MCTRATPYPAFYLNFKCNMQCKVGFHNLARTFIRPWADGLMLATHFAGGWQPLADAIRTAERNASEGTSVAVIEESVRHDRILPSCAALISHGGAGTVAAAFRAGIPQVVCPLHFDQFFWVRPWTACTTSHRIVLPDVAYCRISNSFSYFTVTSNLSVHYTRKLTAE